MLNDSTLEIQGFDNFFVAGALASLSVGPASKNIDGIRLASELILPVLEERISGQENVKRLVATNKISGLTKVSLPE